MFYLSSSVSLVISGGTNSPAPANSFFDTIICNFLYKVGGFFFQLKIV